MKSIIRIRSNIRATARPCFPLLAWAVIVLIAMTAPASAGTDVTLEGIMQGATCVHYKTSCPDYSLAEHIAIEKDFVLLLPDGEHYFLPNLDRAMKARYAAQHVRITGDLKGHGIWVATMEVKKDSVYRKVWRWKDQRELYKQEDH